MITYEEALQITAERTSENRNDIKRKNLQRRTNFTHIFGDEYSHDSDYENKVVVYISIPRSIDRWMLYQYKIIIEPRDLDTSVGASNFKVSMGDIDVTPYLMAQWDGQWIDGEGIFPGTNPETDNYDVLQLVGDLKNDKVQDFDLMLEPGLRRITVQGNGKFKARLILYADYSHVNR